MRLGQIAMGHRLATERAALIHQRAEIRNGKALAITYNGTHCDSTLLELIRPLVIGELSGRIRALEADLVAMGVGLA